MGRITAFLITTFLTLFLFIFIFGWLPTISFGYYGLGIYALVVTIIAACFVGDRYNRNEGMLVIFTISSVITLLYLIVIPLVTSWSLFHSSDYNKLLSSSAEIEEIEMNLPVKKLDSVRTVTIDQAMLKASTVLGDYPELSTSSCFVSFSEQIIDGRWYWVAPLEHIGFLTWWSLSDVGTKGYIKISGLDESDWEIVLESNDGRPIVNRYQEEAFYGTDLERHLYRNGFKTRATTDYTYEVDDTGYGWYVCTIYDKTIGFGGSNAYGVVVVDPASGEMEEYSIESAPDWIDCIQPANFIDAQINQWGEYIDGWKFAKDKKMKRSIEVDKIIIDGRRYYYAGITSKTSDKSNIGYMLIDTRTKEVKYCKTPSVIEKSVLDEINSRLSNYENYTAKNALPYNVSGIGAYVSVVVNDEGSRQFIAITHLNDFKTVGLGKTKQEAYSNFMTAYASSDIRNEEVINVDLLEADLEIEGKVIRISDIYNGNMRSLILSSNDTLIFELSTYLSPELVLTDEGDVIYLEYNSTENRVVVPTLFDNRNIK